jgi:hypothetical protein
MTSRVDPSFVLHSLPLHVRWSGNLSAMIFVPETSGFVGLHSVLRRTVSTVSPGLRRDLTSHTDTRRPLLESIPVFSLTEKKLVLLLEQNLVLTFFQKKPTPADRPPNITLPGQQSHYICLYGL